MAKTRALKLIRERKLEDLLKPPAPGAAFEASGVIADGHKCYVVLDNIRRVAQIETSLQLQSPQHRWVATARTGEGYEAVTYSATRKRFYLLIEAEKHSDGTFKAVIEECDERWRFKGRRWVDFRFEKRNTGFEGLASVEIRGKHYLLALCEGNRCRESRKKKRKRGRGRIHVLELRGRVWHPVARIKLPQQANFQDYAGLALRGNRLAVVSQESSRLWVGRLRPGQWTLGGRGRVYDFPRTKKGKRRYFTVEGISWLSSNTLVAVSDMRKKRHPRRSGRTDQSIHVFRIA